MERRQEGRERRSHLAAGRRTWRGVGWKGNGEEDGTEEEMRDYKPLYLGVGCLWILDL